MQHGHDDEHQQALAQVIQDVHDAHALRVRFRADGADDGGGDAVAQVDADDHGVDRLEGQQAGHGEGLQDADGGRGALQHEGHARAGEIADQRAPAEAGQNRVEGPAVGQGIHRAGHVEQAAEQNAEAHRDIADVLGIPEIDEHDQHDADHEGDGRQRARAEELQPDGGGAVDVQQADDLAGDRGADVGADDDAEGLVQGQYARGDQTRGDDDGGRAGLDQRRHGQAQDESADRAAGQLFHGQLQRAGGALLEAVPHEAHAVEEHGEAAQQGDEIENAQIRRSFRDRGHILLSNQNQTIFAA